MNKKVFGRKFSRDTTSRRAMYRALVRSLIMNQSIKTTYSKGKVLIPIFERLINSAKNSKLTEKRKIVQFTGNDREVVEKLYKVAKSIESDKGGCLRLINLPSRRGDESPMVKVEFVKNITPDIKPKTKNIKNDVKKNSGLTKNPFSTPKRVFMGKKRKTQSI